MNRIELEAKWHQIKGAAKEKWGELNDDLIQQIDGNYNRLVGKLQELYSITKEEAEKQIEEWKADDIK